MSGVRCVICGGASGGGVVAIVDCCLECYARHPIEADRRTIVERARARCEERQRLVRAQPRDYWGRFMSREDAATHKRLLATQTGATCSREESSRKSAHPPLSAPGELSGVPPNSSGTGSAHLRLVE